MVALHQKRYTELLPLFANASNRMHTSLDIPSIMRVAVATAIQLVNTKAAAVALLVDGKLVFSEYCNNDGWKTLQCRYGAEVGWIGDLIRHRKSLIINKPDEKLCLDTEIAQAYAEQLVAVPVIGKEDDLLACLLLFDKNEGLFDEQDAALLEQLASMVAVAIDNGIQLSESRRIEADLEKSVATYRTLVEQIPAITYIATLDRSRFLFISPQVESLLGYCQDDFLADQEIWSQQIHPEDRGRVLSEVRKSFEGNIPFHSEYRICSKDGRDIWVKDAAVIVRDNDQDIYLQGVAHDITERKQSEEKLMLLAHFDQLTGLANRVLFHDRLDHAMAQAKRYQQKFAVLYLDLDGFKAINDTLGHQAGDELLAEAAHRLMANVREVDTVARMGGDEFTIILNDVNCRDGVQLVADKLIAAISAPYHHIGPEHNVTLSMGIALYPDDSTHRDTLVTAADNAMYMAKNSGKNRYCFHQLEESSV